MTEPEWLASQEVGEMLAFVYPSLSERQRRLFAAACCRRIWHLFKDPCCRAAVELAEHAADEAVSKEDLENASEETDEVGDSAAWAASYACCPGPLTLMRLFEVTGPAREACELEEEREQEEAAQASLLRDIVGNPFHRIVLNASWLTAPVISLARVAYDERDLPSGHLAPARLAVLADALEEAGCTDTEILGHLRAPGPHVRGCHAVDLLLARS